MVSVDEFWTSPENNVRIVRSQGPGMYPHDSGNPQDDLWYENMRRRFEDRKHRWDNDVQRMRNDFFAQNGSHGPPVNPCSPKFPPNKPPVETSYLRDRKDNQMHYFVRFHMPNIESKNINLSVKDKCLSVWGKREYSQQDSSHTSEFHRSITLPKGIREEQISATLTSDNVLIVDCPVEFVDPGFSDSQSDNFQQHNSNYQTSSSWGMDPPNVSHPPVTDSLGVTRGNEFHLTIPMGDAYLPDEIQVRTLGSRLYISARHQERTPVGSSFREFSKEYDVPAYVNPELISANLVNGVLHISSSIQNTPQPPS